MTSEARIAANRANAARSTGPKSARGKEKSRGNALRHGLYAAQLVASGEDGADFAAHHAALRQALSPQDTYEDALVSHVAVTVWRLERLARLEAALLDGKIQRRIPLGVRREIASVPAANLWHRALAPLTRHEARFGRALHRALARLDRHRAGGGLGLRGERARK